MKSKLRVAILTTDGRSLSSKWGTDVPSFGKAPEALLDGFCDLSDDVEIHVISCLRKPLPLKHFPFKGIHFHQVVVPRIGWISSLYLGCCMAVRKLLSEIKPDIVHGQGTERDCAMEAIYSGFPNVLTIHGNMRVHAKRQERRSSLFYKIAAALETHCLKQTDGVVAISSYTDDLVKKITPRTWLLPNAVDRRFFEVKPYTQGIPRILFVGSLGERKNPLGLLKACEPMLRANQCTLALAGQLNRTSNYGKEVMELADAIPGISFLGFLDRESLAEEFSKSSILILPTFEDNCPMVVLEGMAAGLAVAASRVGGVPDLITHNHDGLMFDPHHPTDMRTCLQRLINDSALRILLGQASKTTAYERFHPRIIAEGHFRIYREVLGW